MTISLEEHVARAIATANEQNGAAPYELVIQNKHSREALFDCARAAIAAMREWDGAEPFQHCVGKWMTVCFGAKISADKTERNHRFLEEALELVQSIGCTKSEAHQLVDYVFERDQGDTNQEVGGVMVTLAALCLANGLDMQSAGGTELARVWTKIEKIRAKHAAKPKHSPPPQVAPDPAEAMRETCELCDHCKLKDCRSCDLSGEPNPEAFSREELINALVVKYRYI